MSLLQRQEGPNLAVREGLYCVAEEVVIECMLQREELSFVAHVGIIRNKVTAIPLGLAQDRKKVDYGTK